MLVDFIMVWACDLVLVCIARLACPLQESGSTREAELAGATHYKELA